MSSHKSNSITVKAMGLIFLHCFTSLDRCLLTYHSMFNARFMDLPVSSHTAMCQFVAVPHDGFPTFVMRIVRVFRCEWIDCKSPSHNILRL